MTSHRRSTKVAVAVALLMSFCPVVTAQIQVQLPERNQQNLKQPQRQPKQRNNQPKPKQPSQSKPQIDVEGLIIDLGLRTLQNREPRPTKQPKTSRRQTSDNVSTVSIHGQDVVKGPAVHANDAQQSLAPMFTLRLSYKELKSARAKGNRKPIE